MSLGDRVKELREERSLSRANLAHHAGVSYAFVQQLETGVRRDPGVKNLGAIAAVLDVSVDSLLHPKGSDELARSHDPGLAILPARAEINELLDGLEAEELVSARDLLRVWAGRANLETSQTS